MIITNPEIQDDIITDKLQEIQVLKPVCYCRSCVKRNLSKLLRISTLVNQINELELSKLN